MTGKSFAVGAAWVVVATACRPPATEHHGPDAAAVPQGSASVEPPASARPSAPTASVEPADAGVAAAWVGTYRATTSDPFVDAERKTRYRTRHVLASVARDGGFRFQLTPNAVDDFGASAGCETSGRLQPRNGALVATEEATTCAPLAKLPRDVAVKVERVDGCLLRWVHPSGGLSGGVLDVSLRKRDCAAR